MEFTTDQLFYSNGIRKQSTVGTIAVTAYSFCQKKELVQELNKISSTFVLNTHSDHPPEKILVGFLKNADIAIIGKEKITESLLKKCPHLKAICKYGVGMDNIDFQALEKRKIKFFHEAGVNRLSVAEQTLGLMLTLIHRQYSTSMDLKKGQWKKMGGFQLSGKTIGIIGVGNVGKELIRLLKPFGCKILVNDILPQNAYYQKVGALECSKEKIFKLADVITVHTPLTPLTEKMLSKKAFSSMKKSVVVLNTARGKILDQKELFIFIEKNKNAFAGLDVFETEPEINLKLLKHPRIFCTPHIAGNSHEAKIAMGMSALKGLKKCLKDFTKY